jgi:hypothetical protein
MYGMKLMFTNCKFYPVPTFERPLGFGVIEKIFITRVLLSIKVEGGDEIVHFLLCQESWRLCGP